MNPMHTYLISRRSGWGTRIELAAAVARSRLISEVEMAGRVRWIRSYVTQEPAHRVGLLCLFQAVDELSIHEHAQLAALPCDDVVPVADLVVMNPDPVEQAA